MQVIRVILLNKTTNEVIANREFDRDFYTIKEALRETYGSLLPEHHEFVDEEMVDIINKAA